MEERIDYYPTHEIDGIKFRRGRPLPFGASFVPNGVNFSIFSSKADSCTLVLLHKHDPKPFIEIEFPSEFRTGDVYSMIVFDLDYENLEYGYRFSGPWQPEKGHRFDKTKILCDPYAKVIGGRDVWLVPPDWNNIYQHRARLAFDDFDWEEDTPLNIPLKDLVIYEMHVRGFTAHPSSNVSAPGTFAAIREKIPYLKSLGVNCIELLPIQEFDEWGNSRIHPETGELLCDYWGYNTIGFFAPKAGYAATGALSMQMDELKNLIKELHRAGIEVILDVVFNHTAEGNERGPTISFRGIDNSTYYLLTPDGHYYNFSGCGNVLNCNHPVVRNMVIDCLRYWVSEYHIDGLRFDLASILGRDASGIPLSNPPLLESLAHDPILSKCKLIAEAWDAGGLYQVGSFPAYNRWIEWNGKYRDAIRCFIRGDEGMVGEAACRILGSPDLYKNRGPNASLNFITCHDGFTLHDLFSYNWKHNESNGEDNRDGESNNHSWNCGHEGDTDDPKVNHCRYKLIKNAACILFLSRGIPMMLMGDEIGRTQRGDNNSYCHDNSLSWLNWEMVEKESALLRFFSHLIAFRLSHQTLRGDQFFSMNDLVGSGKPDMAFHGVKLNEPNWKYSSKNLAFLICGKHVSPPEEDLYVAINCHEEDLLFEIPPTDKNSFWRVVIDTSKPPPEDIFPSGEGPMIDSNEIRVEKRSVVVLSCALVNEN